MPIFACQGCGVVENTALSNYWVRDLDVLRAARRGEVLAMPPALCSACDPEIGEWHGSFPREDAGGYLLGADGFLYPPGHTPQHTKIIARVLPGGLETTPL